MAASSGRPWSKRIFLTLVVGALGIGAVLGAASLSPDVRRRPPGPAAPPPRRDPRPLPVIALGRLEPKNRVRQVAGPSHPTVVIGDLFIEEGDPVTAGQTIAILDNYAVLQAAVRRLQAELDSTMAQYQRRRRLFRTGVLSADEHDTWEQRVTLLEADLLRARAELALAEVRAPISGRVLKIHARPGERVGPNGIVDLGDTDHMYAVAEVYETDIAGVHVGQTALVRNPALSGVVQGTVERVGLEVAKLDVLHADPVAKTDARVVEVEIRLADSQQVAGLTNLQVEVVIAP